MTIIDVRDKVPKHPTKTFRKRDMNKVTTLSIHHSAGNPIRNAFDYANMHIKDHDWPGVGYHYVILQSGHIQWCGDLDTSRANTKNYNGCCIGICMPGNFLDAPPTPQQLAALNELMAYLKDKIKTIKFIYGHYEFPTNSTSCPGIKMDILRKRFEVYMMANSLSDKEKLEMLWRAVYGDLVVEPPFTSIVEGAKGDRVGTIQVQLNKAGAKLVIDKSYGPATKKAVLAYQTKVKLPATGVVDKKTYDSLMAIK